MTKILVPVFQRFFFFTTLALLPLYIILCLIAKGIEPKGSYQLSLVIMLIAFVVSLFLFYIIGLIVTAKMEVKASLIGFSASFLATVSAALFYCYG